MHYVQIVAILAVLQYIGFTVFVGRARVKYGVKAPAVTGHEMFERTWRVQMNTLEQLVAFLPALGLASLYWSPVLVAAIGVLYLIGRLLYRQEYMSNPEKRAPGFLLTAIPTIVLLLMALWGAVTVI